MGTPQNIYCETVITYLHKKGLIIINFDNELIFLYLNYIC